METRYYVLDKMHDCAPVHWSRTRENAEKWINHYSRREKGRYRISEESYY